MTTMLEELAPAVTPARASGPVRSPALRWSLHAIDVVALLLAWAVTLDRSDLTGSAAAIGAVAVVSAGVAAIWAQQLYLARVARMRTVEQARMCRVALVVGGAVAVVHGLQDGSSPLTRGVAAGVLSLVLLLLGRMAYRGWLQEARRNGRFARPILLVGVDSQAAELRRLTEDHLELGYEVVGVLGSRVDAAAEGLEHLWVGEVGDLAGVLATRPITGAIVSSTALPADELNDAVRLLQDHGCHVNVSSGLSGIDHRRLQPVHLGYEPLLYVSPHGLSRFQVAVKRVVDLALTAVVGALVAPVLLVAVVAIKVEDGGPVLFRQQRVGRHGRRITILKLRTMVVDAEDRLLQLLAHNERTGPLFKMSDDPRVTRVGRVLRALSIDELPQLWNVLRGEMSLVGPRPALPSEVERFGDRLRARASVLPGVTGLWQVEARDTPSFRSYERLDLFYVHNWSLGLDAMIIVNTAGNELVKAVRHACAALRRLGRVRLGHVPAYLLLLVAASALAITACSNGSGSDDAAVAGQASDDAAALAEDATTTTEADAAPATTEGDVPVTDEEWPVPTTQWDHVPGPIVEPVALDEPAEFGTGVVAEVVGVESVTVEGGLPGERRGPGVAVTVALTNGTPEAISLDHVIVDLVEPDGGSATPIDSSGTEPLTGVLEPGATATGTYHYFLPLDAREGVSLTISYAAGVPTVVLIGNLPGA